MFRYRERLALGCRGDAARGRWELWRADEVRLVKAWRSHGGDVYSVLRLEKTINKNMYSRGNTATYHYYAALPHMFFFAALPQIL